ncbi:MAG TPA: tetratricopeptide repeat protein [Labilithrix sp.]|nr:tetratricopeptide repeat protein [Labilithrix sp.]
MGYMAYYLMPILLAYATQNPAAVVLAGIIWLCRDFLPDPAVWLRTMGRIRKLKTDIDLNPSNLAACRDLARIYLERKRPKKAIALLEQTRERMARSPRHPLGTRDDAELLFYLGLARFRSGDAEGALAPLVEAVAIAPDIGRGEPYMVAADALARLGRWEHAESSLECFLEHNQSSVEVYVKLARVRSKRNDATGTKAAIREAKTTWRVLPGFKQREQFRWFLAAFVAAIWV